MVKKRTFEAIERIRKKYAQKDMSKMPGQWLYKSKTISRESDEKVLQCPLCNSEGEIYG